MLVLAIDPGRNKCGLLLANLDKALVLEGKVLGVDSLIDYIRELIDTNPIELILLGNGTSSEYWEKTFNCFLPVELVDEEGTTLLARERYWEMRPPDKFLRFIPRSLLFPPKNLDAVAALVIVERYFGKKLYWPEVPDFRTLL